MNGYQNVEMDIFAEHFNLMRTYFFNQQLIYTQPPKNIAENAIHDSKQLEDTIRSQILSGKYQLALGSIAQLHHNSLERAPIFYIYQAIDLILRNAPQKEIQKALSNAEEHRSKGELIGEITSTRALLESYLGDPVLGIELSLKSLSKLSEDNFFFRNLIQRNLGIAYTIKANYRKAANWFEAMLLSSHKLGDIGGSLAAYNHLTYLRKVQGRFREAGVIYRKAIEFIKQYQLEQLPHSIKIISGYGHLLLQWHELEQAKSYLKKAIRTASSSDILYAQSAYHNLSEAYIRENDLRSALGNIQDCRKLLQESNYPYANFTKQLMLATEARINLEKGNISQSYAWLKACGFQELPPEDLYDYFGDQLGYILPIAARIYLSMDRTDEAVEVLNRSIPKFMHAGANAYLIRSLNVLAIAYHKRGQRIKATNTLIKAVELGKPENNIGDFIFVSQDLVPLLYAVLESGVETEFCSKLIAKFADFKSCNKKNKMNYLDPLSNRERDVLSLIARGMTNKEIAIKLFLSSNTIKSHSIKIYKKLNVKNRTQAVSKARLLGILPENYSSIYKSSA